eukprot:XP_001705760.1 Hypothetical protein GL50803_28166 [Giardia lamblia ATCC 50803]
MLKMISIVSLTLTVVIGWVSVKEKAIRTKLSIFLWHQLAVRSKGINCCQGFSTTQ